MPAPLIPCPACKVHIRFDDSGCPHCGERIRTCRAGVKAAGAILLGLAMAGCPGDDTTSDSESMGSNSSQTMGGTTMDSTSSPGSLTTADDDPSSVGPESAYGVGDTTSLPTDSEGDSTTTTTSTGSGSDTDTDTDTGTGTTAGSSTTGLEPDYGVPD
jgi:hypothetical protein